MGLEARLAAEMARWERAGLRRRLELPAPGTVDFCSNDYLGLSRHAEVVEAACRATRDHGAGGRSSRLLAGGSPEHEALEDEVAEWLGAEASLLFPSGYQANLGLLTSLAGPDDVILSDRLDHASIIDGCRLSRARVRVFRHSDLDHLESLLDREAARRRCLVVTEGIFSMDGDRAPLAAMARACSLHGAELVVDEAHSVGLLGPEGAGAWALAAGDDMPEDVLAARVVTGGKALGCAGALVVGSRRLREHLVNRARTFVFTTAPPPSLAAALRAAVALVRRSPDLREAPREVAADMARRLGLAPPDAAIVPLVLGPSDAAMAAAAACRRRGLDVRAVRPPTVPEGTSRLRICCHAFNGREEVRALVEALADHLPTGADPAGTVAAGPAPDGEPEEGAPARRTGNPLLLVVGTDTGVGKTVVSAALLGRALRRGVPAAYWKPVQTGPDSDTRTVARLTGAPHDALLEPAYELPLAASPHEAAADAGTVVEPGRLLDALDGHLAAAAGRLLVVELAGGLLVPYRDGFTQADVVGARQASIVIVARSGLGTLNHTLLTVEALGRRGVTPRALVLVGEPHGSNHATLTRMTGIPRVVDLPLLEPLGRDAMAAWNEKGLLDGIIEAGTVGAC